MKVRIVNFKNKNYIVFDNEAFDWEPDPEHLKNAELSIKNDPLLKKVFIGNIFKHFIVSLSEFLGRQISLKEINEAIERGYI